ncbi:hypothetical protein LPJ61_004198 [Coemansia biformis]|uniref:Uncharacterized protein n=1 Tax=Coemansia biformis TaxID=1286918 RepID=A0A9W7YB43_9FUNG|nr:hypothetical protein LPJ61_004198 [Coemansia biformis]
MLHHSNGATTIPDHAGKHIDGPWHCTMEAAYEDFPDMAPSHDLAAAAPAELSATAAGIPKPVHARLMHALLALLTGFFVEECDDEFICLDALYPKVMPDSISECTHHHPAACKAIENTVQLPIFTKSKPGTDKCHILFNNSSNNCLNMCSISMQLPCPAKHIQFLRDACIVSSIDMVSFFTQLCLAADVADFWVYDSTCYGKLHTRHMVQGNSESPVITQAFLTHVLGMTKSLHGKLLAYINNVYLKDMASDEAVHIMDISIMLCCLAAVNITVNMWKSLWCMTSGMEVLGHSWSADCSWVPFDHCIMTLQGMDFPATVSSIRRLCSGINSISEHIPWLQVLLAPFYEATGKVRLTKADQDALHKLWAALVMRQQDMSCSKTRHVK